MEDALVNRGIERALDHGARADIYADVAAVEKVFTAWVADPSQTVARLAVVTGVPAATVRKMIRGGKFQERYLAETEGFRAIAEPYTRQRVHDVVDTMVDRLTGILEAGEDRDSIAAARVLAGMISPEKKAEIVSQVNHIDAKVISIAKEGITSIDDVRRLVGAAIDGNISQVEEGRAAKSR